MSSPPPTRTTDARLHPQVRALLDAAPPAPVWSSLSPAEARAAPLVMAAAPEPVAGVTQRSIPGPGGWLRLRIYRPAGDPPYPALVYLHGGGWVFGSLDGIDRPCRAVAQRAGCVVVSVDYRLAPETKFPGALEDVYAALEWVASPAAEPAIDARRIAVGGNSAGGNLAAAVALMARDRSGPPICFQLLVVPMLDRRFDTPSYEQFADGPGWRRDDSRWAWGHYLARAEDADHPYASVLRAADLTRLPPALVVTAGCDPLRDEGEAYAVRLRDAGVDAVASRYEGMPHGFLGLVVDDARRAIDDISAELRRRFAASA